MADNKTPTNFSDIDSVLSLQLSIYEDYILGSLDFYLNRLKLAQEHCWEAEQHRKALSYSNHSFLTNDPIAANELAVEQDSVEKNEWLAAENTATPEAQKQHSKASSLEPA